VRLEAFLEHLHESLLLGCEVGLQTVNVTWMPSDFGGVGWLLLAGHFD